MTLLLPQLLIIIILFLISIIIYIIINNIINLNSFIIKLENKKNYIYNNFNLFNYKLLFIII